MQFGSYKIDTIIKKLIQISLKCVQILILLHFYFNQWLTHIFKE